MIHCSRRLNVEKAESIVINNILKLDNKILDKATLLMSDLLEGIPPMKDIENLKDKRNWKRK